MIELVDRIDRISPRIPDRSRQPRRPFPPVIDEDEEEREPGEQRPPESGPGAPESDPARDVDPDEDDHTIDIVVVGRILPTRQSLPGAVERPTLH